MSARLPGAGNLSLHIPACTSLHIPGDALAASLTMCTEPPTERAGHISEKTDSFAFGVIILELLTNLHPT